MPISVATETIVKTEALISISRNFSVPWAQLSPNQACLFRIIVLPFHDVLDMAMD